MERRPGPRPRARDLGLVVGGLDPGPLDAITDVPGVRVGHTTVRREPDVHTGVTAVVPEGVGPNTPLPAGVFTGNGYGKLVGTTQLAELGTLETPVLLTSTLSTFRVADALVGWMLERPGCEDVRSLNPVVGECNDGLLSDIRARPVREEHVRAALDGAAGGPVAEGCVGAGTGTVALGFKAGIGTASRRPALAGRPVTVGVLTQANFGGTLRVLGRAVTPGSLGLGGEPARGASAGPAPAAEHGSCVIVVATEAPLDARQLTRVARRAVYALARVGAAYGHGSGDYAVAFGTRPAGGAPVPDAALGPLFEAVLDAVEESVLNALLAAVTTTGFGGHTAPALPADRLLAALRAPGPPLTPPATAG
ncbi:S58 family peptidase [Streptomyces sp. 3MP-14]|uniref:S58 family peptidase n=1 Tax=Streptomyces mimosae TaxID=2586635 RepID=A0A5N6AQ74_9ACTN|nr:MULTISPECIES: P1 family peptidase [Streptomyces]KAB8169778.1 S58 family peptidase [Streptomyces mimosae]KAB8178526.1 S58 family peptidase [Streptomyces sp. 3MP-14]